MIRYFRNGFCIGVGGERWTCAESGNRITFKIYLGKWIVTWDTARLVLVFKFSKTSTLNGEIH